MELGLLVNNAALAHYMPLAELPPEAAQSLVQRNVLAPILLTRSVVPGMVERGVVLLSTSPHYSPSAVIG